MAEFDGNQITRLLLDVDKARRDIDVTASPSYASTLAMFRRAWTNLPLSEELIQDTEHLIRIAADQSRPLDVVKELADQIKRRFLSEYGKCGFYAVPQNRMEVYEDPFKWFGPAITNATMNDARVDVIEACRCYALGRWTASVFHSMRVLEVALRALGTYLVVTLTYPIEQAGWSALRKKIDHKIEALRPTAKTQAKTDELEAMSRLNRELGYCQHEWRDYVCHARRDYNEEQALEVLRHVKAIMGGAALRLT